MPWVCHGKFVMCPFARRLPYIPKTTSYIGKIMSDVEKIRSDIEKTTSDLIFAFANF